MQAEVSQLRLRRLLVSSGHCSSAEHEPPKRKMESSRQSTVSESPGLGHRPCLEHHMLTGRLQGLHATSYAHIALPLGCCQIRSENRGEGGGGLVELQWLIQTKAFNEGPGIPGRRVCGRWRAEKAMWQKTSKRSQLATGTVGKW